VNYKKCRENNLLFCGTERATEGVLPKEKAGQRKPPSCCSSIGCLKDAQGALSGSEHFLGNTAQRADPIGGQILELHAFGLFIINISASGANVLHLKVLLFLLELRAVYKRAISIGISIA